MPNYKFSVKVIQMEQCLYKNKLNKVQFIRSLLYFFIHGIILKELLNTNYNTVFIYHVMQFPLHIHTKCLQWVSGTNNSPICHDFYQIGVIKHKHSQIKLHQVRLVMLGQVTYLLIKGKTTVIQHDYLMDVIYPNQPTVTKPKLT